jgi:hypothetical protein
MHIMNLKKKILSQAWRYMLIIPTLGWLRQEDCKFQANLGYIVRPYQKKKKAI